MADRKERKENAIKHHGLCPKNRSYEMKDHGKPLAEPHHYHAIASTGLPFTIGVGYPAVCCYCNRVQIVLYKGPDETSHLGIAVKSSCGGFADKETP